MIYSAAQDILL